MMQEVLPLSVSVHGFDTFHGEYDGLSNSYLDPLSN
jgi:hypothetical protein